ncbi:hypothetical protein [Telmatospirillum siberiense]|uniref:Lipoprotein n=1 Tax=Telmatospirillum siberiense TaxID=382514 RepID=A0A2N3PQK1_9PROT|nr:hypothetical protein [Telmatospirillum siberiense]PKU22664.1 hypothetical protein CWS72_20235 [Telmatospirillum siberiense]
MTMRITTVAALAAVCLLTACKSEPIYLRNAATGATAQCGPYNHLLTTTNTNVSILEQKCVSALKEQGYEPLAAPKY